MFPIVTTGRRPDVRRQNTVAIVGSRARLCRGTDPVHSRNRESAVYGDCHGIVAARALPSHCVPGSTGSMPFRMGASIDFRNDLPAVASELPW